MKENGKKLKNKKASGLGFNCENITINSTRLLNNEINSIYKVSCLNSEIASQLKSINDDKKQIKAKQKEMERNEIFITYYKKALKNAQEDNEKEDIKKKIDGCKKAQSVNIDFIKNKEVNVKKNSAIVSAMNRLVNRMSFFNSELYENMFDVFTSQKDNEAVLYGSVSNFFNKFELHEDNYSIDLIKYIVLHVGVNFSSKGSQKETRYKEKNLSQFILNIQSLLLELGIQKGLVNYESINKVEFQLNKAIEDIFNNSTFIEKKALKDYTRSEKIEAMEPLNTDFESWVDITDKQLNKRFKEKLENFEIVQY